MDLLHKREVKHFILQSQSSTEEKKREKKDKKSDQVMGGADRKLKRMKKELRFVMHVYQSPQGMKTSCATYMY